MRDRRHPTRTRASRWRARCSTASPVRRARRRRRGWWILYEPELHLGDDVLVPDLAGWRRERMPTMGDVAAFTLAPDWVCEIISPSTARIDRSRKMRINAREAVAHLWMVDPLTQTIEIYRRDGAHWLVAATYAGNTPLRAEPFAAVELDVARWWRRD